MERLQKIIARTGLCSRRAVELLLREGRITVNGHVASLGECADPSVDCIKVDGKALPTAPEKVYLMLNKPRGYVTTLSDERNRPTAAQLVSGCGVRVFPVGRLDMNSEGLLLFTNDGDMMEAVIHPRHEIEKVYRVTVRGELQDAESRLAAVADLDGETIRPAKVCVLLRQGDQMVLRIVIHEGKNRQIRRMCRQVGLSVVRLERIQEGKLRLGELPVGKWRYLTDDEIKEINGKQ